MNVSVRRLTPLERLDKLNARLDEAIRSFYHDIGSPIPMLHLSLDLKEGDGGQIHYDCGLLYFAGDPAVPIAGVTGLGLTIDPHILLHDKIVAVKYLPEVKAAIDAAAKELIGEAEELLGWK